MLGLKDRDQVTKAREQRQGGNCVPCCGDLNFQRDPYLIPLLLCFKVSIHLLALCCATTSARPWSWVAGHGRVVWAGSQASQRGPGLRLCGGQVSKYEHQEQTAGRAGCVGGQRGRASLRKEKRGDRSASLRPSQSIWSYPR